MQQPFPHQYPPKPQRPAIFHGSEPVHPSIIEIQRIPQVFSTDLPPMLHFGNVHHHQQSSGALSTTSTTTTRQLYHPHPPELVLLQSDPSLLVNIQPSRVANVLIPLGSTTALVYDNLHEPHHNGEFFDEPLLQPVAKPSHQSPLQNVHHHHHQQQSQFQSHPDDSNRIDAPSRNAAAAVQSVLVNANELIQDVDVSVAPIRFDQTAGNQQPPFGAKHQHTKKPYATTVAKPTAATGSSTAPHQQHHLFFINGHVNNKNLRQQLTSERQSSVLDYLVPPPLQQSNGNGFTTAGYQQQQQQPQHFPGRPFARPSEPPKRLTTADYAPDDDGQEVTSSEEDDEPNVDGEVVQESNAIPVHLEAEYTKGTSEATTDLLHPMSFQPTTTARTTPTPTTNPPAVTEDYVPTTLGGTGFTLHESHRRPPFIPVSEAPLPHLVPPPKPPPAQPIQFSAPRRRPTVSPPAQRPTFRPLPFAPGSSFQLPTATAQSPPQRRRPSTTDTPSETTTTEEATNTTPSNVRTTTSSDEDIFEHHEPSNAPSNVPTTAAETEPPPPTSVPPPPPKEPATHMEPPRPPPQSQDIVMGLNPPPAPTTVHRGLSTAPQRPPYRRTPQAPKDTAGTTVATASTRKPYQAIVRSTTSSTTTQSDHLPYNHQGAEMGTTWSPPITFATPPSTTKEPPPLRRPLHQGQKDKKETSRFESNLVYPQQPTAKHQPPQVLVLGSADPVRHPAGTEQAPPPSRPSWPARSTPVLPTRYVTNTKTLTVTTTKTTVIRTHQGHTSTLTLTLTQSHTVQPTLLLTSSSSIAADSTAPSIQATPSTRIAPTVTSSGATQETSQHIAGTSQGTPSMPRASQTVPSSQTAQSTESITSKAPASTTTALVRPILLAPTAAIYTVPVFDLDDRAEAAETNDLLANHHANHRPSHADSPAIPNGNDEDLDEFIINYDSTNDIRPYHSSIDTRQQPPTALPVPPPSPQSPTPSATPDHIFLVMSADTGRLRPNNVNVLALPQPPSPPPLPSPSHPTGVKHHHQHHQDVDTNIADRDEDDIVTNDLVNHVLLGGILIATPPRSADTYPARGGGGAASAVGAKQATATTSMTGTDCRPECRADRNEQCSSTTATVPHRESVDGALAVADSAGLLVAPRLCVCRAGFARMFPDRPCKRECDGQPYTSIYIYII